MALSLDQSTPLENLQFGRNGAQVQVGGRTIELAGDERDPAVGAFRSFYQSALADYRVRYPEPQRVGWFGRIRDWLGRVFGARPHAVIDEPPPLAPRPPPPPSPPPAARTGPPPPAPGPAPSPPGPPPPVPPPPTRTAPRLRSAYADRAGVHLLWDPAGGAAGAAPVAMSYPFDSAAAHRLQECYAQLTKLGHPVVSLTFLKAEPAAEAGERAGRMAEVPAVAAPGRVPAPTAEARPEAPEKKEPLLVMRLHPAAPSEPNRAMVAPVEDRDNLQILVAPERLVRALYAAAGGDQPADTRLTYLRCRLGKGGLKVAEVGLGESRTHGPARWEEVSAWWEAAQKNPEFSGKRPRPMTAATVARDPELGLL